MSKKKFSVENEDLATVRTSLLNSNLVRKLIMEMSDEDFNQVKDNLEKAIEQRNELKDSLAIIKKYMDDAGVTAEDVYREFGKKLQTGRKNDSGESKEGANKQVISSQADSLIKISRIWADFFPANTSNQPI
ncbi:hypothetical protein [Escherichia coli]|uniref:hypothetical protein n=1 Tax=Escherichia coli TaxID=562 RepID=UPI00208DA774|nr:hypothetical protein [Escherichia coli]